MEASKYILQSFNIFDETLAANPKGILNHLRNNLNAEIANAEITDQTSQQNGESDFIEHTTAYDKCARLAVSVGIEGDYGLFSASVQTNYEKDENMKSTSFNSSFAATVDKGCIYYNNDKDFSAIRNHLSKDLIRELDSIETLADAKEFTEKYGTHLVLGVNLGGKIMIKISAGTSSYKEKEELSVAVKAMYKGVSSISAAVDVTNQVRKSEKNSNLTQDITATGGDSSLATAIDTSNKQTVDNWLSSCTEDTICGVSHSLEIWQLSSNKNVQNILKDYCNLIIVKQSLMHPTVFSTYCPLTPLVTNTVERTVPNRFKVIAGGASVPRDSSSFLVGCYPSTNLDGWCAQSHDLDVQAKSDEHLTAYAIAVFDPGNMLDVSLISKTTSASDNHSASIEVFAPGDNILISGGGCYTSYNNDIGVGPMFIRASYLAYPPTDKNLSYWHIDTHDYAYPTSGASLHGFAICLKSNNPVLKIEQVTVSNPDSDTSEEHGDRTAELQTGFFIAGGSIWVNENGSGNLIQEHYPTGPRTWQGYNKDAHGLPDPEKSGVYAIGYKGSLII